MLLFAELASTCAPLVRTIVKALPNSNYGGLRDDFFRDLLRRGFSEEDSEKQLDIAIDWGRYGELFEQDADAGELILRSTRLCNRKPGPRLRHNRVEPSEASSTTRASSRAQPCRRTDPDRLLQFWLVSDACAEECSWERRREDVVKAGLRGFARRVE